MYSIVNQTFRNCHNCSVALTFKSVYKSNSHQITSALQRINRFHDNIKQCFRPPELYAKVIYNSVIKNYKHKLKPIRTTYEIQSTKPSVVSLKYFTNENLDNGLEKNKECLKKTENNKFNLPFLKHDKIMLKINDEQSTLKLHDDSFHQNTDSSFSSLKDKLGKKQKKKWMKDYDKYSEVSVKLQEDSDDELEIETRNVKYGSADPNVPPSSVSCGGCGAHLHCQDYAIPGFLPKEIFAGLSDEQLQALICQRCHFLREYDTALSVSVDPQIYPKLLSQIKEKTALVILVVDMTDFPCSIWPGILDVIGPKRPLIVVGNKIDLLQDWSNHWLDKAKQALINQIPSKANVLHVALVSAKSGYGIENLVTTLYNLWEYRGDVYLVGCTNVGKSTLFNALIQTDYCKTKAVELMQRATISPWPGTTLNLLKFPIMRPDGWRLAVRMSRLRQQAEEDRQNLQQGRWLQAPQMIANIERTWSHGFTDKYNDAHWEDPFAMPKLKTLRTMRPSGAGLDPKDATFAHSKWLYDSPGVITPDQVIDLLTTEELMLTLPRVPLVPRTFQVWPGQSLLLAGLGRIDYIGGPQNIKMTVLAAGPLPVTLCWIEDANDVYNSYLGTEVLAVPCGGEDRLQVWPGLKAVPEFTLKGSGWQESCADVVLSSAGWVAVTAKQNTLCRLQAWTPEARGIHVRMPPVLPRAIAVKGIKMHKTQAYALFNDNVLNQLKCGFIELPV